MVLKTLKIDIPLNKQTKPDETRPLNKGIKPDQTIKKTKPDQTIK